MDIDVSPDIDAFWSYLIVLLLGLVVARRQVASRLESLKNVWLLLDTWILFLAYVLVPLALFWLLDRTAAVKDSSLFAALLVGVGYERILSGNDGPLAAPEGVASYWSPFLAYANRVTEKIRDAARRSDRRLRKRLLGDISADSQRYQKLEALAKSLAPDVAVLDAALREIDADAALGASVRIERKAALLYDEISASEDFLYELKDKKLVSARWYYWHAHQLGGKLVAVLAVAIVLGAGFHTLRETNLARADVEYALWRLEKPNASAADLFRAEARLEKRLGDPRLAERAFARLAERLRAPDPSLARIDRLLSIALDARREAERHGVDLSGLLIAALVGGNADVRARVHRALLFLAEECGIPAPEALRDWSPSEGDSIIDLQRRTTEWRTHWRAGVSG